MRHSAVAYPYVTCVTLVIMTGLHGTSRRGLLKAGLAAGAVVGTGAWRFAPSAGLRQPGSLPYPRLPAGTDTIPQIEHIVVLMMENHSFDNKLGMLRRPGVNGFRLGRDGLPLATNPYANGDIQHAFRMPTTCQNGTVTQEWGSHPQLFKLFFSASISITDRMDKTSERTFSGRSHPLHYWRLEI